MVVDAVEVSMSIEDCCVASARNWSMLPSVSAKALSSPSSFIFFSQPTRSSAAGVANVASVAGASRPLPLLTMSSPIPVSQVSKNQRSALNDSGLSDTPASLSALACV